MRGSAQIKRRPGLRAASVRPEHARVAGEIASFLRRRRARGYIVGGMLRDHLAGLSSDDMDLVVRGESPIRIAEHLHRSLGFSRPVVFSRFKTVFTTREDLSLEICPLHRDPALDSKRRDFTVNCLYADVARVRGRLKRTDILDPTGLGLKDLRAGLLRTPVDPVDTLWLDPVRILRAVRFGATLGFRLEPGLRETIPRLAYLLRRVAAERVRDELVRIITSRSPVSSFRLMQSTGILSVILPEVDRTAGFDQDTPYHSYDLFTHTLKTAAYVRPDLKLRMAALLHDLGKMDTRTRRQGRSVYYGHDEESARIAKAVLRRLKFPGKMAADVTFLVGGHMINYSTGWSDRAVRRLMRKMDGHLEDVLALVEADRKAQHPDPRPAGNIRELKRRIAGLEKDGCRLPVLPVTGHDIMAILGLKQGPVVGRAKEFLLEEAMKRRGRLTVDDCRRLLAGWRDAAPGRA
ncbi:CCA tRNA nucleotidyltransferase [Candidatus Eisenbacteria bacterium]|uniref:CCA tRNA nucleotidyltransferase n=1 Tax=Eiseniibacteriota bacterium TaxID=2212470 RepID=A0ABV6YQ01_UNCEI